MIKKFLVFILIMLLIACKKKPGPLSVELIVTPSELRSGENIYRYLIVKNEGGKVSVNRFCIWEECINGWNQGEVDTIINLSFSAPLIPEVKPGETDTLYWEYITVFNWGESDLEWKSVAVVDWDGNTDSDTAIYTVKKAPIFKSASVIPSVKLSKNIAH
ncbi:MAG: hypothetical protein ABIK93_04050 [candidate division WOR-3 bacterium]